MYNIIAQLHTCTSCFHDVSCLISTLNHKFTSFDVYGNSVSVLFFPYPTPRTPTGVRLTSGLVTQRGRGSELGTTGVFTSSGDLTVVRG